MFGLIFFLFFIVFFYFFKLFDLSVNRISLCGGMLQGLKVGSSPGDVLSNSSLVGAALNVLGTEE